jgi:hypothetical protein
VFAEDVSLFFQDFTDAGVLNGAPVQGILDSGYVEPLGGVGAIIGYAPTFTLPASACIGVTRGATLAVGANSYTVRAVEPDEHGDITILKLQAN